MGECLLSLFDENAVRANRELGCRFRVDLGILLVVQRWS
jgi:hypothetical protein